ncbi:type I polyketide synthase [Anaeromicropila populeti]|uniref:Phosphopantetheine attachment site n=1 Tax=Anaeromicropila populeti TaxID=37658 RepID=A0A1I6ITB3_9FIRM|nr:type I polyketide synthase [Anaeromicropila populeti]SFR69975.1 Phosphopantetheine attachment site [Anaeromicropila populeti]
MKKKNIKLDTLGLEEKEQCLPELSQRTDIAVIGISAKMKDLEGMMPLWEGGMDGQSVLAGTFPKERFKDIKEYLQRKGISNPRPEMFVKETYLDEISLFDAKFFNVLPNDAVMMEPAQRIMLEHAWNALQDAGYSEKAVEGSHTGVFIGYSVPEYSYQRMLEEMNRELYDKNLAGTVNSVIASRISYYLDLKGPSVMIDTACSSSLVAVHMACQSLLDGECKMALAGGIKYYLIPEQNREENGLVSVVSLDGFTRTFDQSADGTNGGEGVAAVVLKPLQKALSDGDNIYAVIKAAAVNQDGASVGITAPNSKAQKEVICKAWEKARINPETITYIEAHGTATKLGDPIEITGINTAFAEYTKKKNFCAVSSLKSGIGHLDCAAGIFGLVRAVFAMKNRQLPGSLHFRVPNRNIPFIDGAVYVNDGLRSWDADYPRRAGVSSFGISGTNSHVVLEEAPMTNSLQRVKRPYMLTLSIKDKKSEKRLLKDYVNYFEGTENTLENICYTSNISRSEYGYRYAFVLQDKSELSELVRSIQEGEISHPNVKYMDCHDRIHTQEARAYTETAEGIVGRLEDETNPEVLYELLKELADAYVNGADIEWDRLKEDNQVKKVVLPPYPYWKEKFWPEPADQKTTEEAGTDIDRLLGKVLADSLELVIFENSMSTKTHAELEEHIIGSTHVLAGTVYVEMIQRAVEHITGNAQMEIINLVFQMPMTCEPDKKRQVHIVVVSEGEQYKVSIQSTYEGEGKWTKHVTAAVQELKEAVPEQINVNEIESRIQAEQKEDREGSSTETLVKVGPRWNPDKVIIASDSEVFARIRVPNAFLEERKLYHIYPPMLDASVNAGSILNKTKLFLPYYFGKIRIYQRMPDQCCSYLKKHGPEPEHSEITSFDGKIFDPEGNVIAEFEHYSMKKTHEKEREQFMRRVDSRYHATYWKKNEAAGDRGKIECCVVIRKENQWEDSVLQALKKQCGQNMTEIILTDTVLTDTVQAGENGKVYVINESEQEYESCINEMYDAGQAGTIIFLAGRDTGEVKRVEELKQNYQLRVKSLYYLMRVLSKNKKFSGIQLMLLTQNAVSTSEDDRIVSAENALILGMGKALMLENDRIKVKCIDADSETYGESILQEMETISKQKITAYRRNQRYIQCVGTVKTNEDKKHISVQEEGIYLITGGLGGAGLVLAERLASENKKVKLALVNRSPFPQRQEWKKITAASEKNAVAEKIKRIEKIEESGAEIEIICADVTDYAAMKQVLEQLRSKYGSLKGIIHAAGLPGGGLIMRREWEDFQNVLGPKVEGTWILDDLTKEDELDFFVLFSSYSSLFCETGQTDYITANSYLDAFAYRENCHSRKIMTMNWTGWGEAGMAADNNVKQEDSTVFFMSNQEAANAFRDALETGFCQILIGEYNYPVMAQEDKQQRFLQYLKFDREIENNLQPFRKSGVKNQIQEVLVSGKTTGKLSDTEQKVANIWGKILGFKEIEYKAKFLEIGGDSLSATYLQKEIEKEFPGIMDITDVFVYSSVCDMAQFIESRLELSKAKKTDAEKPVQFDEDLVALLQMVGSGQMKVEDANKLL